MVLLQSMSMKGGVECLCRQLGETDEIEIPTKHVTKKLKTGKSKKKSSETFEEKLARSDPGFLEFLKGEKSDLLAFDDGELSADSDEDEKTNSIVKENGIKKKKKTKESLKAANTADEEADSNDVSEASDDAAEDDEVDDDEKDDASSKGSQSRKPITKKAVVTLKMVQNWTKRLKDKDSLPVMVDLIGAFKAAVQQVEDNEDDSSHFKVVGSEVFNAVVQACLQEIVPFLLRHLKLPESLAPNKPVLPSTSPRWKQVRLDVKTYVADVVLLVSSVGSVEVVRALLKHVLDLIVFVVGFPKLSKTVLKKLIEVWSSCGDDKNTLLAFCAIHRLLRIAKDSLFDAGFKLMYTAYVRNTKFTSPSTLSTIQVMQRTLVEVGRINVEVTYKYAFTFIRQLAIHLRSAMTVKKKETTQIVYNWQFIHSLSLWTRLICELNSDEYIHSLIYPLTQIIIGTIKLVPTAQYYPLRFLCVRQLNKLSLATSTFIPVLPFLTEVLTEMNFHKTVRGSSMQSYNFLCLLKLSKSELSSKSFRDGVIDQVYELILDNMYVHAHSVGFPELCLPVILELRKFVKSCKVTSYTRSMKELLTKITETSTVIVDRRRTATLNLRDVSAVVAWESKSREAGTPIGKFYTVWRKLRDQQLQAELSQSGQKEVQDKKRTVKTKTKTPHENEDDLSDFDDDELALLAESGSDEDDGGSETSSDEIYSHKVTKQANEIKQASLKQTAKPESKVNKKLQKKIALNTKEDSVNKDSDLEADDDDDDIVENMNLSDSDNNEDSEDEDDSVDEADSEDDDNDD